MEAVSDLPTKYHSLPGPLSPKLDLISYATYLAGKFQMAPTFFFSLPGIIFLKFFRHETIETQSFTFCHIFFASTGVEREKHFQIFVGVVFREFVFLNSDPRADQNLYYITLT